MLNHHPDQDHSTVRPVSGNDGDEVGKKWRSLQKEAKTGGEDEGTTTKCRHHTGKEDWKQRSK